MKCKRCLSWTPTNDTCSWCGEPLTYIVYDGKPGMEVHTPTPRRSLPVVRTEKKLNGSTMSFLQRVNNFIRVKGMRPSTFGMKVVGDPGFVSRMQNGANPREATIEKVLEYITAHG